MRELEISGRGTSPVRDLLIDSMNILKELYTLEESDVRKLGLQFTLQCVTAAYQRLIRDGEGTDTETIASRHQQIFCIITRWANLSGQDRCWHHPEILHEIADVLGIKVEPMPLPPRAEFEAGCASHQHEIYDVDVTARMRPTTRD